MYVRKMFFPDLLLNLYKRLNFVLWEEKKQYCFIIGDNDYIHKYLKTPKSNFRIIE